MAVTSRWMFVFIGNNETGKTTIQRTLVELLNGRIYDRLPSNTAHDITHSHFTRKCRRFFIAGRSYQELLSARQGDNNPTEYSTVPQYFERRIDVAGAPLDIAFIASHLDSGVVAEMIDQAHLRYWNVCGVFLTSSIAANPRDNGLISALAWDER